MLMATYPAGAAQRAVERPAPRPHTLRACILNSRHTDAHTPVCPTCATLPGSAGQLAPVSATVGHRQPVSAAGARLIMSKPQRRSAILQQTHFAPLPVVDARCQSWTLTYLYKRGLAIGQTNLVRGTQYLLRRYQGMPFPLGHRMDFGPRSSDDLFAAEADALERSGVLSVEVRGDLTFAYLCRHRKEYLDYAFRNPNAGPVVVIPRP